MDLAPLSPPEPFAPARATRIDWAAAARLLGQGLPSAEVASRLGCSRQHVWRILQRSKRVLGAVAAARERIAAEADAALLALLPGLVEALGREVQQGNARVLLWLAQRLGVGNMVHLRHADYVGPLYKVRTGPPADPDAPIELEAELGSLSNATDPPAKAA